MLIVSIFQQKLEYIIISFSLVQWVEIETIIFEKISFLKKKDFILAAKMFGKNDFNIILSDLLTLCYPQILISSIYILKRIVLIESGLSFLGYSVIIPHSSWGSILADAEKNNIYSGKAWWMIILPSVSILLTSFSLQTIGNYFNRRFNENFRN